MSASELLVLIVIHAPILREGFRLVVDRAPGLRAVATGSEPHVAMKALRTLRPGVALIDARLPHRMAFFLARAMNRESPSTRVVILSRAGDEESVQQAAEAGAAAVVLERIGAVELGAVLRTVGGDRIDFLGYLASEAG